MKRLNLSLAAVATCLLTAAVSGGTAQAATAGALYNGGVLKSPLTGAVAGTLTYASADHHTAKFGSTCVTDIKPTKTFVYYLVAGSTARAYGYACGTTIVGGRV